MVRFGLLQLFESPAGRTEKQFFNENIELIEYADEVGLDQVWLAEHHFSDYGVMPSTQVFGAFAAARTKRIRLGTGVVVLPFHNPIRVAEEFAFIDQLSDGRLDFGVGRGYQPAEFKGYGIRMEETRERYDESLEIIRQAWTEDEVNFEGKHYQFKGIKVRPRPMQTPHPPFFGASFNPDTIRFQGEKGLNLLFSPLLAPPSKVDEYRSALKSNGHDPSKFRVGGLAFVYVNENHEKALDEFEDACMWYFRKFTRMVPAKEYPDTEGYYKNLHGTLSTFLAAYDAKEISFRDIVENGPFNHAFLVGSPDYVRNKLHKLVEMYGGMTEVLCWTRLGGLNHELVMRSMEKFVSKVVKPLREQGKLQSAPAQLAASV